MVTPTVKRKTVSFGRHKVKQLNVSFGETQRKTLLIIDNYYNLNHEIHQSTFINLCFEVCKAEKKHFKFVYQETVGLPFSDIKSIISKVKPDGILFVHQIPFNKANLETLKFFCHVRSWNKIPTALSTAFTHWSKTTGFEKGESGKSLIGFNLKHLHAVARGKNYFTPITEEDLKFKLRIIKSIKQFKKFLEHVKKQKVVALDVESANLNRIKNTLFTIQFGFEDKDSKYAYVLPWKQKDHKWSDKELNYIKKTLKKWIDNPDLECVFHFGQFDIGQICINLDLEFFAPKVWDTIGGVFAEDENHKSLDKIIDLPNNSTFKPYALEYVENKFGIFRPDGIIINKEDRANMAKFSLDEIAEYGAIDVITLLLIRNRQLEQCTEKFIGYKSKKEYHTLVTKQLGMMISTFSMMMDTGIYIDLKNAKELTKSGSIFDKTVESIKSKILDTKAGRKTNKILMKRMGINPSGGLFSSTKAEVLSLTKPGHLRTLFFDVMGLEPTKLGKSGEPSTDKSFQKTYKHLEEVKLFSHFNKTKILKSTFADGIIKRYNEDLDFQNDGRLRPFFGFTKVLPGRISVVRPNCVVGDTRVLTKDGVKLFTNLKIGDYVWTHKDRWRKITATFNRGVGDILRIRFNNGESIECSYEHLMLTTAGWKTAETLQIGDSFVYRKEMDAQQEKHKKSTKTISEKIKSYFRENSKVLRCSLSIGNTNIKGAHAGGRIQTKKETTVFPLKTRGQKSTKRKIWGRKPIFYRRMRRWLWLFNQISLGKWEKKTGICTPGCYGESFRVGDFAENFRCPSYRRKYFKQRFKQFSFIDPFSSCCLTRTVESNSRGIREKEEKEKTKINIFVTKIEKIGRDQLWDIEVDEDHSYTSNGIISHNSQNIATHADKEFELHSDLIKGIKGNFSVKPGRVMVGTDFSAHEVRMAGVIAKDGEIKKTFLIANNAVIKYRLSPKHLIEKAAEVLAREGDIHLLNVKFFFKKTVDKKHPLRQQIKTICFGVMYGKMAKALAKELGIEVDEAQALIDVLFEKWDGLYTWMNDSYKEGKETFMVHYPNHRIRHLWAYLHDDIWVERAMDRRAVNSPIQGLSSDIGVASVYLYKKWVHKNITKKGFCLDSYHTNIVHDANYSDTLYEHSPFAVYLVEHSMSTLPMNYYKEQFNFEISTPLGYGMELGKDWASLNEWDFRPENLLSMLEKEGQRLEKTPKQIQKVLDDTKFILKIREDELKTNPYKMKIDHNSINEVFEKLHMFREQR